MASEPQRGNPNRAHLSLWDTISIIIGIVIGAGIYETVPLILQNVSGPLMGLGVWVLGGLLSLIGALCYAELGSTYPRSGGDYVYLSRAYGSWAGFLFAWGQLIVLMTGSIGMMAYIFAHYASTFWSFGPASQYVYALGAVLVISAANIAGMVFGKRTQNVLSAAKVAGLLLILLCGLFWPARGDAPAADASTAAAAGSFGFAMILVLYTYGGWNDAAFVVAEVKDKRNIPRALVLGTLALTLIYVAVNGAYLLALGFHGARESGAIAADVLARPFGQAGARAMSVLVMISALGALNGLVYTGARVYATLGEDYRLFSRLARWHPRLNSPAWSLAAQAAITVGLMTLLGTTAGRSAINSAFGWVGMADVSWETHGGFDTLLRCTAPVFWFFFLMTGLSLFVLRFRERERPRPFTVPLYPVLPLIFCATCGYMLYSAAAYAGGLIVIGLVPVAFGIFLYWLSLRTAGGVTEPRSGFPLPKTTEESR
ncbi:MAG TPA: amino acid permease [Verrucomicrobia bacterium]|nr:amino acid permease [Verrucomicrobiota bacterium]HOP95906.1 amino acid permease [Verrucomicrobiota bacterium]HPU56329.1 amino acid permease [Verrucomicrobiota bacterium]